MVTAFIITLVFALCSFIGLMLAISDPSNSKRWFTIGKACSVVLVVCYCVIIYILWETNCFIPTSYSIPYGY